MKFFNKRNSFSLKLDDLSREREIRKEHRGGGRDFVAETPDAQPQDEDSQPRQKLEQQTQTVIFRKRHLHAFIAAGSTLIIIVAAVVIHFVSNTVYLSIPAKGLVQNTTNVEQVVPIRILSFNADIGAPAELLYYADTTATITDGRFNTSWTVPDYARNRQTYTEICLLEGAFKYSDAKQQSLDSFCKSIDGLSDANENSATMKQPDNYNAATCTVYVPEQSTGLLPWLFNWQHLNEEQFLGCTGSAKDSNRNIGNDGGFADKTIFGDSSLINELYNIGSSIPGSPNTSSGDGNTSDKGDMGEPGGNGNGLTEIINWYCITMQKNDEGCNADTYLTNTFSRNFNILKSGDNYYVDLTKICPIGDADCQAAHYGSIYQYGDNVTINMPTFTIDQYGRISQISEESVTIQRGLAANSGGDGTTITREGDHYVVNVNAGKGLTVNQTNNKLEINAPTCVNDSYYLTWNGNTFRCISSAAGSTSFYVDSNGGASSVHVIGDEHITFNGVNGQLDVTQTQGSNGPVIEYSLTETGVNDGAYNPSVSYTNNNGKGNIAITIPRFTVDEYGRLVDAGTTNILNLSGSEAITINSNGSISVKLTNNSGLSTEGGLHLNLGDEGSLTVENGALQVNMDQICKGQSNKKLYFDTIEKKFKCNPTVNAVTIGNGLIDGSGNTGTTITDTGTIALPDIGDDGTYGSADPGVNPGVDDDKSTTVTDATGPNGAGNNYGNIEWNVPIFTVDEYGRIVDAATQKFDIDGTKAIYIGDSDNNGQPDISLKLCNTTAANGKDSNITECDSDVTASSGLKIASGGLGVNLNSRSGMVISDNNMLMVNVVGTPDGNTDGQQTCAQNQVLTFKRLNTGVYSFVCVAGDGSTGSMTGFDVTANHDSQSFGVGQNDMIDFVGSQYDNNTNTVSDENTNPTPDKTTYNNIEVSRDETSPNAEFNFNLGETGVADSAAGNGISGNDAKKTVNGATTYTDSENDQSIAYYVPQVKVDKYGRLVNITTTNAWNLNAGQGLDMDANGNLSINAGKGLTFEDDNVKVKLAAEDGSAGGLTFDAGGHLVIKGLATCSAPASALQWDGANGFQCVDGYEWKLGAGLANADSGIEINDSNLVSFLAGNGLSVSRSGNSITYNANLASIFGSTACSATQKLTWNGASVMCVEDIDTKYDTQIADINSTLNEINQSIIRKMSVGGGSQGWRCYREATTDPWDVRQNVSVPANIVPLGYHLADIWVRDNTLPANRYATAKIESNGTITVAMRDLEEKHPWNTASACLQNGNGDTGYGSTWNPNSSEQFTVMLYLEK